MNMQFEAPNGAFAARHSERDKQSYRLVEQSFESSTLNTFDKLEAFPRFTTKRSLSRFLVKYEIYKQILQINGAVVECGVFNGAGLFTWAQLANIFEPTNYNRKVIGFDSFEGFPETSELDNSEIHTPRIGDLRGEQFESFQMSIDKYNSERHLSHIPNVELIKGDFLETANEYLKQNKHLLVSLLYLDFDLYAPTKKALEVFLPRMGKGAVICFDELNCGNYPGETVAMLEQLDIRKYVLNRSPIEPWISYIVL